MAEITLPRVSRKRRLPIATHSGSPIKWQPVEPDWLAIERAADFPFPPELRGKIEVAVNEYLAAEIFERAAPFADAAIASLAEMERNAFAFLAAAAIGGLDRLAVEAAANKALAEAGATATMRQILRKVRILAMALAAAREGLSDKKEPAFREGHAWGRMARKLHKILSAAGMPCRISKSPGHNQQHSPFVRFFSALQSTFPTQKLENPDNPEEPLRLKLTRYDHSHEAMAAALDKATGKLRSPEPQS